MKKLINLTIVFALLTLCSCSQNTNTGITESVNQVRPTDEGIPIPTVGDSGLSDEEHINEYPYVDWDYSYNEVDHYIWGEYIDPNFHINYNLIYHDYDVTDVSVYSSEVSNYEYADIDGWITLRNYFYTIPILEYCDIGENVSVSEFIETNFSDDTFSNTMYVATYNVTETDLNNGLFEVINNDYEDLSADFIGENKIYFVRQELDGLPLGISRVNSDVQRFYANLYWNEYFGAIFNSMYSLNMEYYSEENFMIINVEQYNVEDKILIESGLPVVPLTECIENSLDGIAGRCQYSDTHSILVYSAELEYAMFSNGHYLPWNPVTEVFYIPIWEISFCSDDPAIPFYGSVFLNATTGELMGEGVHLYKPDDNLIWFWEE